MPESQRLTSVQWLVCIIAAIGFAFDIYELLMLPLVARSALMELGGISPGTPEFARWFGLLFYVPALCGGIFGLLGGYLTDRFGRRRVLTWSILLYAVSACLSGFSTSLWMLLFFRTTTFVGVCVEFVAAVAWLAELFDNPVQREKVLGYTQAFSSFGGLLVAFVNGVIAKHAMSLPAIQIPGFLQSFVGTIAPIGEHADWRYTMMSGLIPAIPLIIIRPFLPESPKWAAKKAAGTLQRPSIAELFSPKLKRTTIVTTLMFACSYGVAFGALQQLPQILPGLDTVQAKMTAASEGKPKPQAAAAAGRTRQVITANYTKSQELGGLFGRFALAVLVVHIVSRRNLLRFFLIPGLIVLPMVFYGYFLGHEKVYWTGDMSWLPGFHNVSLSLLGIGIFLAGFFTVGVFSFWGNYLPHVFPVHLRGTGESFAANIGGRMLGTPFAFVTQFIATFSFVPGASPAAKIAVVSAGVAFVLILCNLLLSCLLPEPGVDAINNDGEPT
ncbi:MFS transporter [Bythopirellula polymerisocia]|uniref:Putative sialic acid transporter n=1 Tax=Bythopirellula polymerisocia TaxID=2528003 RepID=A0A5C6CSC2_9BACT|nr:MFS transporter [Bythopirellula polymerisocia]TWU27450.1 putative sialic acid transporter [Bythopirellula polymerisocia]